MNRRVEDSKDDSLSIHSTQQKVKLTWKHNTTLANLLLLCIKTFFICLRYVEHMRRAHLLVSRSLEQTYNSIACFVEVLSFVFLYIYFSSVLRFRTTARSRGRYALATMRCLIDQPDSRRYRSFLLTFFSFASFCFF